MVDIKDIREEDLNSCYKDVAKVIGLESTLKLGKEFGGEHFDIHKLRDGRTPEEFVNLCPRYVHIVEVIGLDALLKLAKEFSGEAFYLPKLNGTRGPLSRARERMIIEELKTYRGPIMGLARKYEVTSRCVYDIIKRANVKKVDRGELR